MKSQIHEFNYQTNKILSKTTKIIFALATVLLLSLLATSCIPNTPDGNPTPTNTFEVNINRDAVSIGRTVPDTSKILVIDGDSITFRLFPYSYYGVSVYLIITTNSPYFELLNVKQDGFNYYTNAYDTTHYYADASDVNTLDSGIVVNDSYNTHAWLPFVFNAGRYYTPLFSKLFQFNADGYQYLIQGMPRNRNQYIILRKLKGTQYQYYWVRVRNDDSTPLLVTGDNLIINIKVLNGKYQMNSITTGQ